MIPGDANEMKEYNQRHGSPERHARIEGVHSSTGMANSIAHSTCHTDPFSGAAGVKATTHSIFVGKDMKKEVWKPKTTLKWHEPYRAPLSLQ